MQKDKQEEGAEAAQETKGEPQKRAEKIETNGQRKIYRRILRNHFSGKFLKFMTS